MKSFPVLLASLIVTSAPAASLPEVDRYVEERIRDHLLPGLAMVVIRGGEIVHRRGFGELDPTDPVVLGSLSKAVTATVVMTLVDEGAIDLDAPMQRYLPEVAFSDPGMRDVTVRHLLNQTSGLPANAPRASQAEPTLDDHVDALRQVRLVAPPGTRHIYSSPNYQLLGRIVETVTGDSFGEVVHRRLFAPLQMAGSSAWSADAARRGHNLWWGVAGPATYAWEADRLPTASLVASADDLALFALAHLGIGPQVVSAESLALLHHGAVEADGFSYAMGWRAGPTAGVPSLWHGGALPTYRGAVVLLPESQSAVIVLTNVSTMFTDHTREIASGIVALLEGRPIPEAARPPLRSIYLLIAIGSVLLIGLSVRGFARALRGPLRPIRMWSLLTFDFFLPIAAVLAAPRLAGVPYRAMWEGAPDIALTVMVVAGLSVATALVSLARIVAARRPRLRSSPAN